MYRTTIIALAITGTILTSPPGAVADPDRKALHLRSTDMPIDVDGLPEAAWETADSTDDFFQLQPYYDTPPTRRTVAKVLTTADALYCLMICYAPPDEIQVNTGVVDQTRGDIVSIMLDTFDDRQTAYKFAVTAAGVRADCRLIDDARNRDYSWDGVWTAATKVYDWGFIVEIEVPYRSIKYNPALASWGLDFDRWQAHNSEDLYWCAYEQNEGQRISKFGELALDDFRPGSSGLNLEVYPVGISKATLAPDDHYDTEADVGLDLFYNPSEKLTLQATANPDFAQIEADPFDFNISRYESFFDERRPFFTQGNEIFRPAGRERNSGFYRPLEMFYSRRIGKLLPDGHEVPLIVGTKAFGKAGDWDYGGFYALTGERDYTDRDGLPDTEPRASFVSGRVKKRVFDNSSIGVLFVGKQSAGNTYGVLDIDGAFRAPTYQLAYQVARSVENGQGDFAGSVGFRSISDGLFNAVRARYIGKDFDISQVGYVPWQGTGELVTLSGPVWNFETGALQQLLMYAGVTLNYERADRYTDHGALIGINMGFRDNWGYEVNFDMSKSRDADVMYNSYSVNLSAWFNVSPAWNGNVWGGYQKTYNFSRDYLAFYSWAGFSVGWNALQTLNLGTSYDMFIEGNPDGNIEDITFNARPYFSLTPFNDLNVRVYTDYVFVRSSDRLENVILGLLFSYNFLPKSWIYFAVNDVRNRGDEFDAMGNLLPSRMHVANRAGVLKVKYLYYF
jgi:hypothetical protein